MKILLNIFLHNRQFERTLEEKFITTSLLFKSYQNVQNAKVHVNVYLNISCITN